MSAHIIAIANQKGGVGKTTTAVNLAASLAADGRRVLVVDLDPQGNATTGSGVDKTAIRHGVYHVLLGEMRLKNALAEVADDYDFILIDCPPTLTLLTLNGLVAADGVIVPMVCEYYALEGISDLVATVRKIRQAINPKLDLTGIVRTMFDSRSRLAAEVGEQLQQHFGSKLFATTIPRNVRLAEAPSHGMPALVYDAKAKGTQAYRELAAELQRRLA